MSCPCIVMRAKSFSPALQLLKNLLPADKKPLTLPLPPEHKSNVVTLPAPVAASPPECLRCGRTDHQAFRCTAKYDVNGYEI